MMLPKLHSTRRQTGAVLVVSLVFLLIITIVSMSMFGDIRMQETMSGNHRAKSNAVHVANSALREEWVNLLNLLPGEQATDARTRSHPTAYDQDLDGDASTSEVDMTVDVAVCFNGTTVAPGTDTDFQAYMFVISSTATDSANARSQLMQGGYIVAPTAPGLLPVTCP